MALVKCPECGRENVSDSAASCPECGYAIKEHFDAIRLEEQKIAEEKKQKEKEEAEKKKKKITDQEKLLKEIRRLEKSIISDESVSKKSGVLTAILAVLTIIFFNCPYPAPFFGVFSVGIGMISLVVFLCFHSSKKDDVHRLRIAKSDLEKLKSDFNEYEAIIEKREQERIKQQKLDQARYNVEHPKCPMCGSTNTEKIGAASRVTSVAALGLASKKIGKQYKCYNCKHMW